MRDILAMARLDLAVWRRSPWAIAVAIIPPLGMYVLIHVLSLAVTQQPVALVMEGTGPQAQIVFELIRADTESYQLRITDMAEARRLFDQQKVAAIIHIPASFDEGIARGRTSLDYTLNNVDIDYSDDIRRSIDTTIAEFEAPHLGEVLEETGTDAPFVIPNPYRVDIAETNLRDTDVPFETYQVLPVLLLLIITIGVLGGSTLGSRDHERGTATFLRSTPVPKTAFILGRLLGTLLATLIIVVPVLMYLIWNGTIDPPRGHWPPFLAILGETAVFSAGLGVLFGVVFKRSTTAALVAVIAASYLFFLGGGFTTIAFLPDWLRTLSQFVPTKFAIDGMRQTLFYSTLDDVGANLAALGVFAILSVAAGIFALEHQTT